MRIRSLIARVSAFSASLVAGAVFAQAAPAAPTSALAMAQAIDMSDAKSAGLAIVAALIGVGVTLWGARLVLSKFRPKV